MPYIYAYHPFSQSARALADYLGIRRIRHRNSRFNPQPGTKVINWGATLIPGWGYRCRVYNNPNTVSHMSRKDIFFQMMSLAGVDWLPPYTIDYPDNILRYPIVCRTIVSGHSGRGIVIANSEEELVDAPLYVQYIKKSKEYRVHLMNDDIIDVQTKVRNRNVPDEEVDWQVRSHHNGFIYTRNNNNIPDDVLRVATECFNMSGLDFGAVDVIWNERQQKAYVLEINTAPGLEGTSVEIYGRALQNLLGD